MADQEELYRNETHQIIGSSMEVLNELGHGFHEKIYENALVVEFGLRNVRHVQQQHYPVEYKSVKVGDFIPDLICFDAIVVDTKTIKTIGDQDIGKMLNYLKVTGLTLGMLINFSKPKLQWKRVVRQRSSHRNAQRTPAST